MALPESETLTDEEKSKDAFFKRIAAIGGEMTEKHGKDFATGAFVLAARWISEGRLAGAKNPDIRPS